MDDRDWQQITDAAAVAGETVSAFVRQVLLNAVGKARETRSGSAKRID